MILAKLRRARLLAREDPHNPGQLDTHPLVREYFGEQLHSQQPDAWKECNRRLYHYFRTLAPQLPDSIREMEPLFSAVICGCNAGLFREALHEVYIPRIQRGDANFCGYGSWSNRAITLCFSSFLRIRALGIADRNERRGGESHCGRSALHPRAGGAISNSHTRTPITRSANLPRTPSGLVSFAWSSGPPVFCADGPVALFPHDGQTGGIDADC